MGFSILKGLDAKGVHLKVNQNQLEIVKNRGGCCLSKAKAAQAQEERLALAFASASFLSNASNLVAPHERLQLYQAVKNKQKQIHSLISGFIGWLKSIFRSKAHNRELKLQLVELQKFQKHFSQKLLIDSIALKHFPANLGSTRAVNDKVTQSLKKELPELFTNKYSLTPKDFEQAPFLIRQVGLWYKVMFPGNIEVEIRQMRDLPLALKRFEAKKHFSAVQSLSTYPLPTFNDQACRQVVGKVNLRLNADSSDLNNNELTIQYYDALKNRIQTKSVDLSSISSEIELRNKVESYAQKSRDSLEQVMHKKRLLENFIKISNISVTERLCDQTFEIAFNGQKIESLPFSQTINSSLRSTLEEKIELYYVFLWRKSHHNDLKSYQDYKSFHQPYSSYHLLKYDSSAKKIEIHFFHPITKLAQVKSFQLNLSLLIDMYKINEICFKIGRIKADPSGTSGSFPKFKPKGSGASGSSFRGSTSVDPKVEAQKKLEKARKKLKEKYNVPDRINFDMFLSTISRITAKKTEPVKYKIKDETGKEEILEINFKNLTLRLHADTWGKGDEVPKIIKFKKDLKTLYNVQTSEEAKNLLQLLNDYRNRDKASDSSNVEEARIKLLNLFKDAQLC